MIQTLKHLPISIQTENPKLFFSQAVYVFEYIYIYIYNISVVWIQLKRKYLHAFSHQVGKSPSEKWDYIL